MSEPAPLPSSGSARRRLPLTLYILSGVMLFRAILVFILVGGTSFAALQPAVALSTSPDFIALVRQVPWAAPILAFYGVVLLVSALGMLGRQRVGWLLAMIVTGLAITLDIYGWANGGANHLWMGLNIVTVFYLNQRDVRETLGVTSSMSITSAEPRE